MLLVTCFRFELSLQALGKITADGVFLEQLETDPIKYLPEVDESMFDGDVIKVRSSDVTMRQCAAAVSRARVVFGQHSTATCRCEP